MKKLPRPGRVSLVGEIVELRERGDARTARVLLTAICFDIPISDRTTLKLGDSVLLEATVALPSFLSVSPPGVATTPGDSSSPDEGA
ncbi:MAG: hypothetical protein HY962_07500 [Ignavibacteriae bacterium]|nr:hypothetical protein [Ignavibacteriota bacterium]